MEDARQKSVKGYKDKIRLEQSLKEQGRNNQRHYMDKLAESEMKANGKLEESESKADAKQLGYKIFIQYIKNRHQSELEEKETLLKKAELYHIEREVKMKGQHEKAMNHMQTKQSKKKLQVDNCHKKMLGKLESLESERLKKEEQVDKVHNRHKKRLGKLQSKRLKKEEQVDNRHKKMLGKLESERLKMEDDHEKIVGQLESKRLKKESTLEQRHEKDVDALQSKLASRQSQVDKGKDSVHNAKVARRQVAQETASNKVKLQDEIKYLKEWLNDMADELKDTKRTAKDAAKKASNSSLLASKRLGILKDLKHQVIELQDDLAEESHIRESLERMSTIRTQIKRERPVGRRGGSGKWPIHIVLLICELLVNGTPPSAVPANIQTMSAALLGSEVGELPSVDYVRKCRVVVQNINEMLAAF